MYLVWAVSILGGLGISAGTVVAVVRWWLAHRPIRVDMTVKVDGMTVLFAVTNQRQTAEFEGRVTDGRGMNEQVVWPWRLGWLQSSSAVQRIDKSRSAVLRVAEVKWFMAARGNWSFADAISVQLADPSGKLIRTLGIPAGDAAFRSVWSGVELDVELSAVGHYGRRALLTVSIGFVPNEAGSKELDVQIIQRVSS